MEAADFVVVSAADALGALAWLDTGAVVDVLVSDLSMPGMDGLTLIKEAQRRRPTLPAILLTGFVSNTAEVVMGSTVSGTFSLLHKPIRGQDLAMRAAAMVEGFPGRR